MNATYDIVVLLPDFLEPLRSELESFFFGNIFGEELRYDQLECDLQAGVLDVHAELLCLAGEQLLP